MLKKINYRPVIENGVLTGIRKNSIVLEDTEPMTGFDNPVELQEYVKVRKIPTLVYRDIEGDPEAAAQQYADYYANLEAVVEPWEQGKVFKKHQAHPISYGGKLYEVIQGHTTQSDWTPDIVPALFSEIQKPAGDGYPEWAQPTHAENSYAVGDRVTWAGKNWESTIPANTTEPGTLLPWNYWKEIL
jgi:hypothetical protein